MSPMRQHLSINAAHEVLVRGRQRGVDLRSASQQVHVAAGALAPQVVVQVRDQPLVAVAALLRGAAVCGGAQALLRLPVQDWGGGEEEEEEEEEEVEICPDGAVMTRWTTMAMYC